MEIWKDIGGYEGLYQVSNIGRVKRLLKGNLNGRILKPVTDKDGYSRVRLSKNNLQKNHSIHRLVASAFIANPNGFTIINHKDENKANNKIENLEWCTVRYNTRYNNAHTKRTAYIKKAVRQINLDGKLVKVWDSATDAAKTLGISRGNISACCLHFPHFKTAGGYIWEYE